MSRGRRGTLLAIALLLTLPAWGASGCGKYGSPVRADPADHEVDARRVRERKRGPDRRYELLGDPEPIRFPPEDRRSDMPDFEGGSGDEPEGPPGAEGDAETGEPPGAEGDAETGAPPETEGQSETESESDGETETRPEAETENSDR